jgi:hypothetical protein
MIARLVAGLTRGGGNGPTGLAVGDFNRDGLPDLALATAATGDVSILLATPGGAR